jgi:hypothetical protein
MHLLVPIPNKSVAESKPLGAGRCPPAVSFRPGCPMTALVTGSAEYEEKCMFLQTAERVTKNCGLKKDGDRRPRRNRFFRSL